MCPSLSNPKPTPPPGWPDGPPSVTLDVPPEHEGERLDRFLATALEASTETPQTEPSELFLSRERLKQLIEAGHLMRNNAPCTKASTRLSAGDCLCLWLPAPQPLALAPEDLPLPIVFEDDHLLVVNKPAGMLTHPTGARQSGTLVNALLHHCQGRLSAINGTIRPGIVHRLDKDTRGLMVVTKTDAAHQGLAAQLKDKTMRRAYQAIVQGVPVQAEGRIDLPIGRHPTVRNKMRVVAQIINPLLEDQRTDSTKVGRHAITHYQVKEALGKQFSWLLCQLETGRTHQIRVHMAHIGHPLVADPMYGTGLEHLWKLPITGQALQAYQLRFIHPITLEAMAFELPTDKALLALWQALQQQTSGL